MNSRLAALGFGVALLACRAPTSDADAKREATRQQVAEPEPKPEAPTPAVLGCELFVSPAGARCHIQKPKTLRFWFPRASGELGSVRATFDDETLAVTQRDDVEGVMLELDVPRTTGTLELRSAAGSWSLELEASSQAYMDLLQASMEAGGRGEFGEGVKILHDAMAELSPDEVVLARFVEIQLVYLDGDLDRALELVDALGQTEAISTRGAAQLLAVHARVYDAPDFNDALARVELAERLGADDLRTFLHAIYHHGLLDHRVGRIDESLDRFERAARLAALVGDRGLVDSARVMQAVALARLGRFDEAEALAEVAEAELDSNADARVARDIRYDLAWINLLRREHDADAPDPTPILARLLTEYEALDAATDVAVVRLHLALAAAQAGEFARAKTELARVDRGQLRPAALVWFDLIATQLALEAGDLGGATTALERAAVLTELSEDRELSWRVAGTRARLERARGHADAALSAYAEASELADRLSLAVPGSAGRSMIVTAHSRVDAEYVDLLLDEGQRERALCIAASVRARHLRSLWARLRPPLPAEDQRAYQSLLSAYEERKQALATELDRAWELTTVQLEALRDRLAQEGERADELLGRATALLERAAPTWTCEQILPTTDDAALLTMASSPDRQGWRFLLASRNQVEVVELDADASPRELAARALDELAPKLVDIETLTVIPIASFVAVDLRRLLFEHPELGELQLRHSLGLHGARTLEAADDPRAAVIAGADDLDAVAREAATVTTNLRELGWSIAPDWSPAQAQPSLLHYSGHGHHEGLAGWSSYIELPQLGRVSAAQIVAGQRAPQMVVLGACSAGSSDEQIIDGGMNLAAAFLLAGANLVIAPSGPVDDETAFTLASELYTSFERPEPESLVNALTSIQRAEFDAKTTDPGPRSTLRWRAWSP